MIYLLAVFVFCGCLQAEGNYALLAGRWANLMPQAPEIIAINPPSDDFKSTLERQELLLVKLFDLPRPTGEISMDEDFKEDVDSLANEVPTPPSVKGNVRRISNRESYYYDTHGNVVYTSFPRTYYVEKVASVSSEFTDEIYFVVSSATASRIDNIIEQLKLSTTKWKRKTIEMREEGLASIEKRANLEYLTYLEAYQEKWLNLRTAIKKRQELVSEVVKERKTILNDWNQFEKTEQSILGRMIENMQPSQPFTAKVAEDGVWEYQLEADTDEWLLAKCDIGGKTLYFRLRPRTTMTPLRLLNTGAPAH